MESQQEGKIGGLVYTLWSFHKQGSSSDGALAITQKDNTMLVSYEIKFIR